MADGLIKRLKPIDNSGLRNQIEEQVRNAIVDGFLKPGDHLVESAIAEQLQLSRAPVREALSALEREGIIVYFPRRGYFVVEFTPKDIEEIYSLRLLLEIGALRRAIHNFSEGDIQKMQEIVDTLGQIEERWEQSRIANLDLSFHELICNAADNQRLYSVWDRMRMQTWMLMGMTTRTHFDRPQNHKQFHQKILDAILDKDLGRAEALLSEHIVDAEQRALRQMDVLSPDWKQQKESSVR
jgi:DNA-binding GntR family transcriptional regulator